MENYGALCLLPAIVVIITAMVTKRSLEALVLGVIAGCIIIEGGNFYQLLCKSFFTELGDSAYYVFLFGFLGVLIKMFEQSGAALGFSVLGAKLSKTKKRSMILTWVLGIIVFVEDFLNALVVGVSMRKVMDKFRVSREFFAYIVNSTSASVCILIPISVWGIFMAGQIDASGALPEMDGLAAYARSVPFMFYGWFAVFIVPLYCLKIIPLFGPMKKAELRAETTGKTFPLSYYDEGRASEAVTSSEKETSVINFLLPIGVLIAITIATNDILISVLVTLILIAVMYIPQKLITLKQFFDNFIEGFKDMVLVNGIIISAFVLQDINDELDLTNYVIDKTLPLLSPAVFPAIIFFLIAVIAFATGSFWGVAAIAFPIVIPMAVELDVNLFMGIGAIVSGAAFGSHSCFFGDMTTLVCASTEIKNIDYARTSIPLILVPFALSLIAFLVVGSIMA